MYTVKYPMSNMYVKSTYALQPWIFHADVCDSLFLELKRQAHYNIQYMNIYGLTSLGPLLLTWVNFNFIMDEYSHAKQRVEWNYLSIPNFQWWYRYEVWEWKSDYNGCNYLSMPGLSLIALGPWLSHLLNNGGHKPCLRWSSRFSSCAACMAQTHITRDAMIFLEIAPTIFNDVIRSTWHNMGPTWVLSAPAGPHVGPMNLALRANIVRC